MTFAVLQRERIEEMWAGIAPGIATAMNGDDESTLDDVKEGLLSGRLALLLMRSGRCYMGAVVSIVKFHRCSVMRVLYAFGRGMNELRDTLAAAEAWAKASGCKYVEGWVPTPSREILFRRFGYSRKYAVIRKAL